MADTYVSMQQASPTGSEIPLYTASGSFVVSSLFVCNGNSSPAVFSVRIAVGDAASDPKQFLYSGATIAANGTLALTAGITMTAGDVIYVNAPPGVAFQLGGVQTS